MLHPCPQYILGQLEKIVAELKDEIKQKGACLSIHTRSEVPRGGLFVGDHGIQQKMATNSFNQLLEVIEEVSNVWRKWRNAEHIIVESVDDSKWLTPTNVLHDFRK